ncbi:MAG TPA: B12-binding domain-containing protein [Terriglobia bacterium]|nr:B12-binding domain-containing protein [Terriglobia bacterium]
MKKVAYPIRAVSKLTGISIDTLRAWERRYEAIKPRRSESKRVYDEADVARLILLRKGVEGGHAISRLAVLSNKDLEQINARSVALSVEPAEVATNGPGRKSLDLKVLNDAIGRMNYGEIDRELNLLAAMVPPRDLVHQVVVPLMAEIGERWYRGELSVAQEHMVSSALRNLLGSLVRLFVRQQPIATLLFATPKGERHEFGILCAAMLAAAGGLGIAYLGVDLPHGEIIHAARKTEAKTIVLGIKAAVSIKESVKEVHRISAELPESTELWIGGSRSPDLVREIRGTRGTYVKDLTTLEQKLVRLGARF